MDKTAKASKTIRANKRKGQTESETPSPASASYRVTNLIALIGGESETPCCTFWPKPIIPREPAVNQNSILALTCGTSRLRGGFGDKSRFRSGLPAGEGWIRTFGSARDRLQF
jgi:hypothetical protein